MKNLAFIFVAVVCLVKMAASGKSPYRDVLEDIEERLEERISEKITKIGNTGSYESEAQVQNNRMLQNLENEGQAISENSVAKNRFEAASSELKPVLPVCRLDEPKACCEPGFSYINLRNDAPCNGIDTTSGIEIVEGPAQQRNTNEVCSRMALLKINFEKLTKEPCSLIKPFCGRRMLRIKLELSSEKRSGFGFNIGDSSTNNGFAGDIGTQENDAEAEGIFPNMRVWASDKCDAKQLEVFSDAIGSAVNSVTIYVSNQHIRVVNDQGFDRSLCDDCLYALNGQSDKEGPINEYVYLGLNRVVQSTSRNGVGVCSATLSWACPQLQFFE